MPTKAKRARPNDGPLVPQMISNIKLARLMNISSKTLRNWVERGSFPRPQLVAERIMLWDAAKMRAYLESGCWPE